MSLDPRPLLAPRWTPPPEKPKRLIEATQLPSQVRAPDVVKLGGSAMEDPAALQPLCKTSCSLEDVGCGRSWSRRGQADDRAMPRRGDADAKRQGRRVTDDATLAVVVKVLRDEFNAGLSSARSASSAAGRSACIRHDPVPVRRETPVVG